MTLVELIKEEYSRKNFQFCHFTNLKEDLGSNENP